MVGCIGTACSTAAGGVAANASAMAAAFARAGNVKLYYSKVCPYAQRVTLAAHECGLIESLDTPKKGQQLELVPIDLRNKPEYYTRDVNPAGKVPALSLFCSQSQKNIVLVESAHVARFVLRMCEWPGLTGLCPLEEHRVGLVLDSFNDIVPNFYAMVKCDPDNQAQMEEAKKKLDDAIENVGRVLSDPGACDTSGGNFVLGDKFSVAEVMCAPFIGRLKVLDEMRGYKAPASNSSFVRFNAWAQACLDRPSLQATLMAPTEIAQFYRVAFKVK